MLDIENLVARQWANRQPSKVTNERAYIIQEFVDEINKERIDTKWKPVHGRAIAIKLAHIKKKEDLYHFLNACKRYKAEGKGEFGRYFFGALKAK